MSDLPRQIAADTLGVEPGECERTDHGRYDSGRRWEEYEASGEWVRLVHTKYGWAVEARI